MEGEMSVVRNIFVGQSAHACIRVHYLTTEKPGMEVICGPDSSD